LQRQIAIGAQRGEGQLAQVRREWGLLGIDDRDEYLGANVARAEARALLRAREQSRLAPHREVRLMIRVIVVEGGVEGVELLLTVASDAVSRDARHLEYLQIERPSTVGDDVILEVRGRKVNAVCASREYVHSRRAVEREVRCVHAALEPGLVSIEQQGDLELIARVALQRRCEALDVEEEESLREGEVFLQQPVTLEPAQ
jgi:hypothetical protein